MTKSMTEMLIEFGRLLRNGRVMPSDWRDLLERAKIADEALAGADEIDLRCERFEEQKIAVFDALNEVFGTDKKPDYEHFPESFVAQLKENVSELRSQLSSPAEKQLLVILNAVKEMP